MRGLHKVLAIYILSLVNESTLPDANPRGLATCDGFAKDQRPRTEETSPTLASIQSGRIEHEMAAAPDAPQLTPQPVPEVSPDKPKPGGRIRHLFSAWMRDLVISLAIAAFFIVFLYQPVKVEGTSMMPSLDDQERIFINKFVYRLEPIQRGDIVVFRYPRDPQKSFIKRVIGVAGDHVRIAEGRVYVNNKLLVEDYVPISYEDGRSYPEIVVPPDSYFVLGDHRSLSNDSRDFGPVDAGYIYGKAVFGYWPVDKVGRLR